MQYIIILLALGAQILGLFGFVYSCILFLRFDRVKGWFNKKAGAEIVTTFSFRPFRTLLLTAVLGFIMMPISLGLSMAFFSDAEIKDGQTLWFLGIFVILVLIYPAWHLVRRFLRMRQAENKKAERWRFFYDATLNIAGACGGLILLVILSFASVILSLTKWSNFIPDRLRVMSGVEVVPESKRYYAVGVVLGVVAVFSQWLGSDSEDFISWLIGISIVGIAVYAWYQIHSASPEDKKQLSWQWGYMILTTYAVFTITWLLIFAAIALLIIYIALAATGNAGHGKDRYKVTCDNLTDDVINGRGICSITNSRCKARDVGSCPYK